MPRPRLAAIAEARGAAGAMAFDFQTVVSEFGSCLAVGIAIDHLGWALQVAPLQQHRTRAQRQQFDQGGIRGLIVIDGMAEQQFSFGNVRREDRRQWEQPRAQRVERIGCQQPMRRWSPP